ncbi:MAG: helix-turn-helix domain-containing protein [Pseudonocardiaceae bacterium]
MIVVLQSELREYQAMAIAAPLTLREGDRGRLEALVRSASAQPSLAQRARMVLMSAEGLTNTEIARLTGSTRPTVLSWRNRYATGGINALRDLPRSGRPAVVDELEVVAATLANGGRPPAHLRASHWSSRLLGQQLGISFATVARIWRKWGIQPDRPVPADPAQRHVQGQPAGVPDPWIRLIEVSLGIITEQAIRGGTFASVRNLIDALGALTSGWQDHHEPSSRAGAPPETTEQATETIGGSPSRQATSDTYDDLRRGSSRLVENGLPRDLDQSAGPTRDTKPVRAELHGTRGRRSGPTSRPSS